MKTCELHNFKLGPFISGRGFKHPNLENDQIQLKDTYIFHSYLNFEKNSQCFPGIFLKNFNCPHMLN